MASFFYAYQNILLQYDKKENGSRQLENEPAVY